MVNRILNKKMGVRKRMALMYLFNLGGLFAIFFILFFSIEIYEIREDYSRTLRNHGRVLTQSILPAVSFDDKEEVQRQLSAVERTMEYESVLVLGKTGEVLGKIGPGLSTTEVESLRKKKGHNSFGPFQLKYLFHVNENNKNYGTLVISSTLNNLKELYLYLLGTMFLAAVLFAISVWYFVKRVQVMVSDPMLYMLDVMEVVKVYGDYNVRTLDEPERLNNVSEFHQLARMFDELLASVNSKNREIEDYAVNLELKVQDKTDEVKQLEASNIEASKLSALGEMAAGIAHEVNNPLQVIGGNVWFI